MTRTDATPLFNFDEPPAPQPGLSQWREVPQALFLSWSPARQWAYCRDRDLDAALFAENAEQAAWYLARAETYRQLMEQAS